jgi:hypothetical protein
MSVQNLLIKRNSKKVIANIFHKDLHATDITPLGGGKTALAFGDIAKCSYLREGDSADTAITPVTMTVGTWVSGGFIKVDDTNMPGVYQFGIPDACLQQGVRFVDILIDFTGADAESVLLHIDLFRSIAF